VWHLPSISARRYLTLVFLKLAAMGENQPLASDREFTLELREAVQRYLLAVDAWEAAYQKYYRLPGYADQISDDLEHEHREYLDSRRKLEALLPRARGLCFKHGLREPFGNLVRVTLGQHAPQQRDTSAIGRSERLAATDCLMELAAACQEWSPPQSDVPAPAPVRSTGSGNWLRRLVDYLY
jgi:hypothetical protein